MRSLAIEEAPFPLPALFATLGSPEVILARKELSALEVMSARLEPEFQIHITLALHSV